MNVDERAELLSEARRSGELAQLPTPQREALELWGQGLGYKRIAVMLGVGQSSVRGRLDRALSTLKRRAIAP